MDSSLTILALGLFVSVLGSIFWIRAWLIKREGYLTSGTITGYESKFRRVAGKWTWMDYPTITYIDEAGKEKSGYVKYAKQGGRYFDINEEVEIVIYGNTIYYKKSLRGNIFIYVGIVLFLISFFL